MYSKWTERGQRSVQYFMVTLIAGITLLMSFAGVVPAQQEQQEQREQKEQAAVQAGEAPFRLEISPGEKGIDLLWDKDEEPVRLGTFFVHIYTDAWNPRLAMQKELAEKDIEDGSLSATYTMEGNYGEESQLEVTCEPSGDNLDVTLAADVPEEVIDRMGNKTRIMLRYTGEDPLPNPESISQPEDDKGTTRDLEFGPTTLRMDCEVPMRWHNTSSRFQLKLPAEAREQLVGDGLEISFSLSED